MLVVVIGVVAIPDCYRNTTSLIKRLPKMQITETVTVHCGSLCHPETTRNYWPKTGKELATAANILDLSAFLLMNRATARYGISGFTDDLREQLHADKSQAQPVLAA